MLSLLLFWAIAGNQSSARNYAVAQFLRLTTLTPPRKLAGTLGVSLRFPAIAPKKNLPDDMHPSHFLGDRRESNPNRELHKLQC